MAVSKCKECGRTLIRLSWSQLRNAEECKQKRYLAVTGARKSVRDQRLFLPGNITDRVVRDWLKNDPKSHIGEMPEMVETTMERIRTDILDRGERIAWKSDVDDRKNIIKDCVEAVTKIEPVLLKHVVPFEYEADFKFSAPLRIPKANGEKEVISLIGFVDIIVRDDEGEISVFDVKHTRDDSYWRKTVGQLTFYDLATQLIFGKKTRTTGLLQPLCKKPIFPYEISDDLRRQMYQRVVGVANDIWSGDNSPRTDNKFCKFCDFRNSCEKFAPVLIDGKKRVKF